MTSDLIGRERELHLASAVVDEKAPYDLPRKLGRCERALLQCRCGEAPGADPDSAPAGKAAWIADHYRRIEEQIGEIQEALPRTYYRQLPRLTAGPYAGQPRAYALALEAVSSANGRLEPDCLVEFLRDCQGSIPLSLGELWSFGPLLRLALVEAICSALADPSADDSTVRRSITDLRALETAPWHELLESVSIVHQALMEDPAGIYERMDFPTRDRYRHAIEGVARRSRRTEPQVAEIAVRLARGGLLEHGPDAREAHVGHYLIGRGRSALNEAAGYRRSIGEAAGGWIYDRATPFYVGAVLAATVALLAFLRHLAAPLPWWTVALLVLPATQFAVGVVNVAVNLLAPPRVLPRLEFADGIPADHSAMVVVPTLLLSRSAVEKLLERLEIHYLANPDPNLFFALLTDFPDSRQRQREHDGLLDLCAAGIRALNERYGSAGSGPFYLFHRAHTWNDSEGVWMGRERKRGKLVELNKLLLGLGDAFDTKIGDLAALRSVRYVITLDSDTRLPRETARKLVGTMAHPLNRPVLDPLTGTVRDGYAILQPRIAISMESAGRSRLARIYSGQTGYDPYTTAVSDVYQDLHGRATFTGKGIYDVQAFESVAGDRFPDNTLLSHDLIEGEYARTGLVTDLELIDDYPATYQAYTKRKHRWARGDWQTLSWLLPRAPRAGAGSEPNPLPGVSRWKVADNLRRSLVEPALFVLLAAAWTCYPARAPFWLLFVFGILALPAYLGAVSSLLRVPPRRFWRAHLRESVFQFVHGHVDAALSAVFLLHQACILADAVCRTLVRKFITRRRLLEWESMAQSEESPGGQLGLVDRYLWFTSLAAVAMLAAVPAAGAARIVMLAWAVSPLGAAWLNRRPAAKRTLAAAEVDFLRETALCTWRYFADLAGPESNGLAPDNVQEDPPAVAARTSPTNIGLQLAATLAAHDLGYVARAQFLGAVEPVFDAMDRMERCRGHLYNWYDTLSLAALAPRYVSTVDSGNLAAALLAFGQGCREMLDEPLVRTSTRDGLNDYCRKLWKSVPAAGRTSSIARLVIGLFERLRQQPRDLFQWEGLLSEVDAMVRELEHLLEWVCSGFDGAAAGEVKYWHAALAARVRSAIEELQALAPWLAQTFEPQLRLACTDATLAPVFAELERICRLSELPGHYQRIGARIQERLASDRELKPALRTLFLRLSAELPIAAEHAGSISRRLMESAWRAEECVKAMDYSFLFDVKRKLLRIGYNADLGTLDEACYDLLASEARTAVFVAIAKGDIPRQAWFHLGRKLVSFGGRRTLVSWGGTMFEYLMPNLFMAGFEGTLLHQSLKNAVGIQQAWARARGVPWGTSEAAFHSRDSELNYRYQTFGVPEIALERKSGKDVVIAPYASMLALMADPKSAAENLASMAARGWTGTYGFFEAVDHTASRTPAGTRCAVVRAFMVHHQAMGLVALCNTLCGNPMQRRFHRDPLVRATDYLLQERVPLLYHAAPPTDPAVRRPERETVISGGDSMPAVSSL